jgi:hypothetical protein
MCYTGGFLDDSGGSDTDASFNGCVNPLISDYTAGLSFLSDHSPQGCIRRVIAEYIQTYQLKDLVFSPEFSRESQAVICKEATMQGLVVCHRNSGDPSKQYTVLSQRRRVSELVEHIRTHGGETPHHILLEPIGVYEISCANIVHIVNANAVTSVVLQLTLNMQHVPMCNCRKRLEF